MAPSDDTQLSTAHMAELSALADGTLPDSRRAEVAARIAASPELAATYARERDVVDRLREAREGDRAPERLRAAIASTRPQRRTPAPRRWALTGAVTAALAAAAVLAAVLPGPGGGTATLAAASALSGRGATAPAPPPDSGTPRARLSAAVEDVYFPNWERTLGWRATGQRVDRLAGHRAVTVYYARGPQRVAYTILSVPALDEPSGSNVVLAGVTLRVLRTDSGEVVTWRRSGHTCVVSGNGVSAVQLEQLAAWAPPRRA